MKKVIFLLLPFFVLSEYEKSDVIKTASSTPITNSTSNLGGGTLLSNESVYGDSYKETNNCVEGVVVYEGTRDFYIVETRKGYTVLERYRGRLDEGDKVRGELNRYNFKYLFNRTRNSEVKVYIEDYMLSDKKAIELLGEKGGLKNDYQSSDK